MRGKQENLGSSQLNVSATSPKVSVCLVGNVTTPPPPLVYLQFSTKFLPDFQPPFSTALIRKRCGKGSRPVVAIPKTRRQFTVNPPLSWFTQRCHPQVAAAAVGSAVAFAPWSVYWSLATDPGQL